MPRKDLDSHFQRIDDLAAEMSKFAPPGTVDADAFRADLAGLLVVTMAATYESCVKDILFNFASRNHKNFGQYVLIRYEKLNSKVAVGDLHNYAKMFSPSAADKFKKDIKKRRDYIYKRTGRDITDAYTQILQWRHAFAHSWTRNTTLEEAVDTHRLAKRVIFSFGKAFDRPPRYARRSRRPAP